MKGLKTNILICLLVTLSLLLKVEGASATSRSCGSWSVISSPSPSMTGNELNAVAAVTATNIWAVGDTYNYNNGNETSQTLIEHWDGTSWKVMSSPSPGTRTSFLWAVAAISASNIWTVGNYTSNNLITQTLVEHWDGTSWSVVPSPNVGSLANGFSAMAAVSANNIWAVGDYFTKSAVLTLMEHWNGTSWSVVSSPNPGATQNEPFGMAAASASDIWAVGIYYARNGAIRPLIEQWNGKNWKVVSSPKPGSSDYLYGVSAASTIDAWTVGSYIDKTGQVLYTLIEQWNGKKWQVVSSPNAAGSNYNELNAVTVISAINVWAVGYDVVNISGLYQTLVEHWDGNKWSVVSSPNALPNDELHGVAAVSASDVWAVGADNNTNGPHQTLTEFYC